MDVFTRGETARSQNRQVESCSIKEVAEFKHSSASTEVQQDLSQLETEDEKVQIHGNYRDNEEFIQDVHNPESLYLIAETETNFSHFGSEGLLQHLPNPGSERLPNWCHAMTVTNCSEDIVKSEPSSPSAEIPQDKTKTRSSRVKIKRHSYDTRDSEMLMKFNIRPTMVRLERITFEASSCQPARAASGDTYTDLNHESRFRVDCHNRALPDHEGEQFSQHVQFHDKIGTHTSERQFRCNLHGESVTRRAHLKSHIRTHGGKRRFSCTHCNKCFSKKSVMLKHRKIHDVDKLFTCSHCDRTFAKDGNLKEHVRLTHLQESYSFLCSVCDQGFTKLQCLKMYLKSHGVHLLDSSQDVMQFLINFCSAESVLREQLCHFESTEHRERLCHKESVEAQNFELIKRQRKVFNLGSTELLERFCTNALEEIQESGNDESAEHQAELFGNLSCELQNDVYECESIELQGELYDPGSEELQEVIQELSHLAILASEEEVQHILQKSESSYAILKQDFSCMRSDDITPDLQCHNTVQHKGSGSLYDVAFVEPQPPVSKIPNSVTVSIEKDLNFCEPAKLEQDLDNKCSEADGASETPYVCGACEKCFRSALNLRGHIMTHIVKRPHLCNICGKGFQREDHLSYPYCDSLR